jgi:hypothetical protein
MFPCGPHYSVWVTGINGTSNGFAVRLTIAFLYVCMCIPRILLWGDAFRRKSVNKSVVLRIMCTRYVDKHSWLITKLFLNEYFTACCFRHFGRGTEPATLVFPEIIISRTRRFRLLMFSEYWANREWDRLYFSVYNCKFEKIWIELVNNCTRDPNS